VPIRVLTHELTGPAGNVAPADAVTVAPGDSFAADACLVADSAAQSRSPPTPG
jgi:hypothetical protein